MKKSKDFLRSTLNFLRLDLTKNLEYDRLTKLIMRKVIKTDSNCIDVGCHKGELLESILKLSPEGKHFGFEPLPEFYNDLKEKFSGQAEIFQFALGDHEGSASFNHVKNAPAYSGLQERKYAIENPEIEQIDVAITQLDNVIPENTPIDFVKIDVEGGEFGVLKGGVNLLKKNKPVIIFECGIGASDYYGTDPGELFDFLNSEIGLNISLLKNFIENGSSMSKESFVGEYNRNKEYYFVAHK